MTEIETFLENMIQFIELSEFPLREMRVLPGSNRTWIFMVFLLC